MPDIPIIAETPRLIIRALTPDDIDALAALWTDAQVTQFVGGPREFHKVRDSLREDLQSDAALEITLWPVIEKPSGEVVGHCGLLRKEIEQSCEVELIYVIAAFRWGRGYATEAAQSIRDYSVSRLGLKRLVALIDPANAASERVAQKLGMTFEKETVRPSGKLMRLYVVS